MLATVLRLNAAVRPVDRNLFGRLILTTLSEYSILSAYMHTPLHCLLYRPVPSFPLLFIGLTWFQAQGPGCRCYVKQTLSRLHVIARGLHTW
jgi:hypothetical protein